MNLRAFYFPSITLCFLFLFLWVDTTLYEEHKDFTLRELLKLASGKHQGEWKGQQFHWLGISTILTQPMGCSEGGVIQSVENLDSTKHVRRANSLPPGTDSCLLLPWTLALLVLQPWENEISPS